MNGQQYQMHPNTELQTVVGLVQQCLLEGQVLLIHSVTQG